MREATRRDPVSFRLSSTPFQDSIVGMASLGDRLRGWADLWISHFEDSRLGLRRRFSPGDLGRRAPLLIRGPGGL